MKLSKIKAPPGRGGTYGESYLETEIRSGMTGKPYIAIRTVRKNIPAAARKFKNGHKETRTGLVDSSQTVIVYPEQIDALVKRLPLAKYRIENGFTTAAPNESNSL